MSRSPWSRSAAALDRRREPSLGRASSKLVKGKLSTLGSGCSQDFSSSRATPPTVTPPTSDSTCLDEPSDHATEPLVVHVFTESVGAVLPVDSWMVDSGGFRLHAPVAQPEHQCGRRRGVSPRGFQKGEDESK